MAVVTGIEAFDEMLDRTTWYAAAHAFIEDGGDPQSILETETDFLSRPISAREVIEILDSLS